MTGDGFVYHKKDCQLFADPFIIEGRHCTCVADHKNRCPFCGTHVAHSPFGNVWCDQCDYRLETTKFESRPLEDMLRLKIERVYSIVTRALSEHGNDTATLVEIATILEGK